MELSTLTPPEKKELFRVLKNSLYPSASDDSLELVVGYCISAKLNIMTKPVHIVPMWNSAAGKMVDVIMPAITLYRTYASRAGCAGISEPEFGPDVTEQIGGETIAYPKWCKVKVLRNVGGQNVEFSGYEFWRENYSKKGGKEKSIAPNAMWAQRPYAQLAKCAEAQALRKAFPEECGPPTAEEMDGKDTLAERPTTGVWLRRCLWSNRANEMSCARRCKR